MWFEEGFAPLSNRTERRRQSPVETPRCARLRSSRAESLAKPWSATVLPMLIRLLGPVGVTDQNGRFVRLGAAQQRRLLAALAIDIGKPVSYLDSAWLIGGVR